MSDTTVDNNDLPIPDELTTLKARADQIGLTYHPSIGVEKLREKVTAALNTDGPVVNEPDPDPDPAPGPTAEPPADPAPAPVVQAPETENQRRLRKKREANELVRIRITCMNPAKKEWEGELFTAGNSLVGSFTKFVPFNADDGWHVPRIIYNQIVQRQCQVFKTIKSLNGVNVRKGMLIREFAVEVLPQLTTDELHELAQRQAMAGSID